MADVDHDVTAFVTENRFVESPAGGFPVNNIAYWKQVGRTSHDGTSEMVLVVHFRTGGFLELNITPAEFTSLVYGEPY